jgi:hypothetical protein
MDTNFEPERWAITVQLWGVLQRDLARQCGYSEAHLCRLLRGQRPLNDEVRARLWAGLHALTQSRIAA